MFETVLTWFLGIMFSLVGWGSLFHFAWIVRNWPEARARVVGNFEEYAKSGGGPNHASRHIVHFAELEFSAMGVKHRVKGGNGRSQPWFLGETTVLHYKPENPEHILDLNLWQRLLFSAAFIFFGGACIAAQTGYI